MRAWVTAAGLAASGGAALAGTLDLPVQVESGVNFAGAVVGRVPEYWGGRDVVTGVAPMARWQFGGERFVQLLGTEVSVNLVEHPRWRAGPSLGVRLGRDEVSDPVVRQLPAVPATAEVGAFVGYSEPLSEDPRHRWGANLALAGATSPAYRGWTGSASVHAMKPVRPWLTLNLTGGVGLGSRGFNDTYFGVPAEQAGLFPSLGPSGYAAGSGLTDVRVIAGALVHLSFEWHVLAGVRGQRLLGDAADSPLVRERGSADQWIVGLGVVRLWR